MSISRSGIWLMIAVFAVVLAGTAGPAVAQKVPAPITFEQSKDSPGKVTFNHEVHKEKLGKCTACHTKIFKMKKGATGPLKMEKMKAGQQCGACHDGKSKFGDQTLASVSDEKNCTTCHKK